MCFQNLSNNGYRPARGRMRESAAWVEGRCVTFGTPPIISPCACTSSASCIAWHQHMGTGKSSVEAGAHMDLVELRALVNDRIYALACM